MYTVQAWLEAHAQVLGRVLGGERADLEPMVDARQLEAFHGGARDLDLCGVDLAGGHASCESMKHLATEGACRQARDSRQRAIKKLREVALGAWSGGALQGDRHHHLTERRRSCSNLRTHD